jgi:serine/threonine protein phosphatase PrpC
MTETIIYSGSVGDSRAVLGTTELPEVIPVPSAVLADKQILQEIRERRNSNPEVKIWPLQLTKDQKPQDEEEKKRIEKSGGRVQRLLDEFGKRIGPYRVWDKNGNYPGLAMSRSLGDIVAKRIGVISTPFCTTHEVNKECDLFIIIASDGLWDVMDNEDVVNFVECFRRKSNAEIVSNLGEDVTLKNSCIAQVLAEEARLRWFSIVEEEDVTIDDISCVVIEIQASGHTLVHRTKRPLPQEISLPLELTQEMEFKRAPSIKEVTIRDPKRSSVVSEDIQWHVESTRDNLFNQ